MKTLIVVLMLTIVGFAQEAVPPDAVKAVGDVAQLIHDLPSATWKNANIESQYVPIVGLNISIYLTVNRKTSEPDAQAIVDRVYKETLAMLERNGHTKQRLLFDVEVGHPLNSRIPSGPPKYYVTPIRVYSSCVGAVCSATVYGGDLKTRQPTITHYGFHAIAGAQYSNLH